jgi:hypothetical protein
MKIFSNCEKCNVCSQIRFGSIDVSQIRALKPVTYAKFRRTHLENLHISFVYLFMIHLTKAVSCSDCMTSSSGMIDELLIGMDVEISGCDLI